VLVWVADDPADNDGTPGMDSNSAVAIRVETLREDGLTAAAEAIIERTGMGESGLYLTHPPSTTGSTISAATSVRLRSWRELTHSQ
jgi:hypothetical protein